MPNDNGTPFVHGERQPCIAEVGSIPRHRSGLHQGPAGVSRLNERCGCCGTANECGRASVRMLVIGCRAAYTEPIDVDQEGRLRRAGK
jgi:hypothetical protein